MKCDICKATVAQTFLKKPIGTFVKDNSSKKRLVCSSCQGKFKANDELKAALS